MEQDSLQKAIEKYCDRGFGSMNKNDFEVFIFNKLLMTKYSGRSDYDISIDLAIPLSKVKRLRYESSLKYPQQVEYRKLFIESLKGARYDKERNVVLFPVENIALRHFLRNVLMKKGNFYDTSFNSDIIKISKGDFLNLLEDICLKEEDIKSIRKTIRKNSNIDLPNIIMEAAVSIAKNVGGDAVGKLTDLGMEKLVEVLKNLFKD